MTAKVIYSNTDTPTAATATFDLVNEHVVTFAELARKLPRRRANRPTHVGTIHRWRLRGLRGVRLAAAKLGGTWVTSLEAYQRFVDALTRIASQNVEVLSFRAHVADGRTEQILDQLGL